MPVPDIALVRPRQPGEYAVVVQPVHDNLARPLDDGVPLQSGIDVHIEDVATVVLSGHAEVGQSQGGDDMIADHGQLFPALGVSSQDLRGLAEPVQAVEPLADQSGALKAPLPRRPATGPRRAGPRARPARPGRGSP